MLKLKFQHFSHLMRRTDWFEKILILRKIESRRRRGQQRMRRLDGITDSKDISLSKVQELDGQGSLVCSSPWDFKESDTNEWTELNWTYWTHREESLILSQRDKALGCDHCVSRGEWGDPLSCLGCVLGCSPNLSSVSSSWKWKCVERSSRWNTRLVKLWISFSCYLLMPYSP